MNATLHFTDCGLDNVYLVNGFHFGQTGNGEEVLVIQDLDGLHAAIAKSVSSSSHPLDAKTFRFLRKHLDMAQRQIAEMLGVSEDIVSLWERARQPVPRYADLILRTMVKEKCSGNAELVRAIERYNELDRDDHEAELRLQLDQDSWKEAA
jgi:putative transcriptional regulator